MVLARDVPLVALLLVLFLASLFLAASEAALLRVSRVRVAIEAERGGLGPRRLLGLVEDLPHVMNTVLLAVLLTQIATASITSLLADRWFGTTGVTIATVALTLFLFVYAEAIPKTFAVRQPMRVAVALSAPLVLLTTLMRPVVSVLVAFADMQAPGQGIASSAVSQEELIRMAEEAAFDGTIDHSDAALLERSFEFGDMQCKDILVPRVDITAVRADEDVRSALEVAIAAGHRRLALHEGTLDDLVGVVRLHDLASAVAEDDGPRTVRPLMRPILVVPQTLRIVDLLREMQRSARHFAVAVDERGKTAGIVTIEAVVEELVGAISDDYPRAPSIERCGAHRWLVDAAVDARELASMLDFELPQGDYRSVGGLVMQLAGRLPALEDEVVAGGYHFRVVARGRQRIHRIEVQRPGPAP